MFRLSVLLVVCAGCWRTPVKIAIKDPPTKVFARLNESHTVRAAVYDKDGLPMTPSDIVTWSSSDPEVLQVAADGTLTARGSGTATIEAHVRALSARFVARVAIIGAVTLVGPRDRTLRVGKTMPLVASVSDEHGQPVMDTRIDWTAGAPIVAIDAGVVTALSTGSTQITATAGDKSAAYTFTITD